MNKLYYQFDCLDGNYAIQITFEEEELNYEINTTLPGFEDVVGSLKEEKTKMFIDLLHQAQIERWDKVYEADASAIADAIRWSVTYCKGDQEFSSKGEETFEPYGYENLLKAIMLCDEKASHFMHEMRVE